MINVRTPSGVTRREIFLGPGVAPGSLSMGSFEEAVTFVEAAFRARSYPCEQKPLIRSKLS
jgi:hypothetical protein